MKKENNRYGDLIGQESFLSVEEQKELIDYRMKAARRYLIGVFLIVLPFTLLLIAGIIFFILNFVSK